MRKSILACTVSVLMSPVASWALGMGDIQVNSSLNQALNAEIELHSVKPKDLDSLHVGLASKSVFQRAQIDRADYLAKFRFKIIQRGGKNFVSITTRKPFKEPFANFLVEASWASGRLLREYTMLVDPPEFVKQKSKPVKRPVTAPTAQVKRKIEKPVTQPAAEKPPVQETMTAEDELYPEGSIEEPSEELVYGPTKRNDTLWTIAKNMAPDNVSVNQMMMALLRDNPDAFMGNNINNLKSGYVLRIKDPSSLKQIDNLSAQRQVKEQYQSWKDTRQQDVSTTSIVDRSDRSTDQMVKDGELKLLASGKTDTTTTTQGSLSEQTKMLKDKLAFAGEELESKEIENQELRERIKELESILETKTSLVQLKDESLAALQKQKELKQQEEAPAMATPEMVPKTPEEMAPETTEEVVSEPVEMAEEAVEPEPAPITEMAPAEEAEPAPDAEMTAPTEAVETAPGLSTDEIAQLDEVETPEAAPVVAETKPEVKPEAPKTEPKPVTKPEPMPEEPGIMEMLLGKYLPYTAGGGALIIILLAWLGLRGRNKQDQDFEESILDSKLAADEEEFEVTDSEVQAADSGTEVLSSDTETSFLSDFSSDDMESLQPDDTEADPISEADVFMVYGRYTQAEELLKNAIGQEPERLDYQMKLLEVYHGDNQKDSFAVQADVVRDALKKANDDYELTSEWTKAKSWADKLGVDIDMPDSFEEGVTQQTAEEAPSTSAEAELEIESPAAVDDLSLDDISDELTLDSDEINLDEQALTEDLDFTETEESLSLDETSDMELSLDDLEVESTPEELVSEESMELDTSLEAAEELTDSDISLELEDSLDFEEITESKETFDLEEALDLEEPAEAEGSLELEEAFDLEEAEESLELEEAFDLEQPAEAEESLELEDTFDLEDTAQTTFDQEGSLELEEAAVSEDSETLQDSTDELDLLDDNMDLDELDDDFPELDAVGTKLDLAKAYIDMGDMESASSILNEVIDEGNDDQKSQAQTLLSQTG